MQKILIIIVLTLQTLGLSAQDDTCSLSPNELWAMSVQHRLDSITKIVERQKYSAGYCVYDLTADSMLYRFNSQKLFKPASTQKLFVATSALTNLGADYCFKTYINIDGSIQTDDMGRRTLKGDICIRGSFDPTTQLRQVHLAADKIVTLGIDSVDGCIVVDNQVRYDAKRIGNVGLHFGSMLCEALQNRGIRFSAEKSYMVTEVPVLRGWNLATICTPISEVLNRMLKKSDNTFAECMLLNLYDMGRDSGWSYENCKEQVIETVKEVGGNPDDYTIIDGSGLSHDNRSTPELITTLLRYDYQNDAIFPHIYEHLPIAGVDGTLKDRMKTGPAYNNVRAKTGTLNFVSTLAGYVTASNDHKLAFAIMVNNVSLSTGKALQNNICQELAK